MSRFLIIGASGFIGSRLYDSLKASGHEVLGTSTRAERPDRIRFDLARDEILSVLPDDFFEASEPTFVILSAAVVPMDRCRTEASHARRVMIEGSQGCFDQLASHGCRPVFLSTSYVFDGERGGYVEDDTPNPLGNYGRFKWEMESWLREQHPEHLIVRLDKTVGTNPADEHQFSSWEQAVRRGETVRCIAGQLFGLTDVDDVIRMVEKACLQELRGTYHVANPEAMSRATIAGKLAQALGLDARIVEEPMAAFQFPEPRPMNSSLVSDRIMQALGEKFQTVDGMIASYAEKAG